MATLTWRDVAAPNFSGVQDGFRNFGDLLNNAFSAASTGLKRFDDAKVDQANTALLADVAAAQDTDAAKSLLASIGSRPGAGRLSADTIKFAMGRPGELTKQAETEYTFNRTKDHNAALDAARSDVVRFIIANAAGDDKTANEILGSSETLRGLDINDLFGIASKGQGLVQGNVGIAGDRQSQSQSGIRFTNEQTDRNEGRQAVELQGIIRQNGVEPADFDAWVSTNYQSLLDQGISPVVIEKARHAVLSDPTSAASFYETGSLGGGGIDGGPVDMGAAQTSVASTLKSGGLSDAVVAGFLGNFHVEGGYGGAQGDGGSAGGIAQWRDGRRTKFRQMFGKDPASASHEEQAKYVLWELTTPEGRKSAGITDAQANAILNAKDAGTAASLIDQYYERSSGEHRGRRVGAANQIQQMIATGAQDFAGQVGPRYNRSQDPGQTFARGMLEAMNSDADPRTVAAGLVGDKGVLSGENVGNVAGVIKQIAQKYRVSPAAAGLILSKSVDQNKNWYQRAGDNIAGIFGGGDGLTSHIDWDAVNQYGKLAGDRNALTRQATASQINDATSQLVASASQAATAAQARAQARSRAAARLGRNIDPTADLADAAMASNLRDQALANSGAVTVAGGRQAPQAPSIDRNHVPERPASNGSRGALSAVTQARNAQAFLERKFREMVPESAGPVQVDGIKNRFKQRFGISIDQVRKDPNAAWKAAKLLDQAAAQAAQGVQSRRNAMFAR